jgi:sulfite reductase alpha subunit
MIVPFIEMDPENEFEELKEISEKCWDWWMEEGKNRERIGESMQRIGLPTFLQVMEVEPLPQHVKEPRSNPYVFWTAGEVPGGFERDLAEFRKRNPM